MSYCHLLLTCRDQTEATKVVQHLLKKRLIICAKQTQLERSDFWWEGKIVDSQETLLIMDSREDLFEEIETEIAKIHSYDTFVLEMLSVKRVSQKAATWMQANLAPNKRK